MEHHDKDQDIPRARPANWDGEIGEYGIQVKRGIHNARELRSLMLAAALQLQYEPGRIGLCVLVDSRMSRSRVDAELKLLHLVLRDHITSRIHVLLAQESPAGLVIEPHRFMTPGLRNYVQALITDNRGPTEKPQTQQAVAGLMFYLLLTPQFNTKAAQIGEWMGASHPTVNAVLQDLEAEGAISRSVRGDVALLHFPRSSFYRWRTVEASTRKSAKFTTRTGEPRAAESLLRRLRKLERPDIGVGGVLGAKHYFPGLDLSGAGMLEITLHGTHAADLSFVKQLDPAFAPASRRDDVAHLTVNFLSRKHAFFEQDRAGNVWADPVVCMTDLAASGFDHQADDLLHHLLSVREAAFKEL